MIITILAEPRSGSTNLANWFNLKKSFTVLYEPISNPNTIWFKNNTPPNTWVYNTPNLLIKETFNGETDFTDLVNYSDKIIVLYRENILEQTQSFINCKTTGNWGGVWSYKKNYNNELYSTLFKKIKDKFRDLYINNNFFTISYEDLYHNGFQKVIDYVNIEGITNENFPYGKKYRIDIDEKSKKLI